MDIGKLKQFFEQLRGNGNPTAQDIRNAAAAAGNITEIVQEILSYAAAMGIDVTADLADLTQAQETARQEKAMRETAASLAEKSGALAIETDQEKQKELIESINREHERLIKRETPTVQAITSKELMEKQFPPKKWVVENLICSGLTIISGVSKIGKSWMILALAEAASTGGMFLNKYKVNRTKTFHLSLEDSEESIQERRLAISRKQTDGFKGNDDLLIYTEWETGQHGLENYLRANPDIKFVIIDTLGQFLPGIEDINDYAPTVKALTEIRKIAIRLNVAILVVHHAKKGNGKDNQGDWMDQSLGSQGIVASADTIILLQRDISKTGERLNTGKFYVTGRSIRDVVHKVEFSPDFGMWSIKDQEKQTAPDKPVKKEPSGTAARSIKPV